MIGCKPSRRLFVRRSGITVTRYNEKSYAHFYLHSFDCLCLLSWLGAHHRFIACPRYKRADMLLPLAPVRTFSATNEHTEPSKPNEISRNLTGSNAAGFNGIS